MDGRDMSRKPAKRTNRRVGSGRHPARGGRGERPADADLPSRSARSVRRAGSRRPSTWATWTATGISMSSWPTADTGPNRTGSSSTTDGAGSPSPAGWETRRPGPTRPPSPTSTGTEIWTSRPETTVRGIWSFSTTGPAASTPEARLRRAQFDAEPDAGGPGRGRAHRHPRRQSRPAELHFPRRRVGHL